MVTYSYVCECRGKVNKETHPRLCIRPMVTATAVSFVFNFVLQQAAPNPSFFIRG